MKLLGIVSEDFYVIYQLQLKYSIRQCGVTVAELIKKFHAVFARAHISLRLISLLSCHLHLTASDCFLPFTCSDRILYVFIVSHVGYSLFPSLVF